jgi:Protein of unknown function (DUF3574)
MSPGKSARLRRYRRFFALSALLLLAACAAPTPPPQPAGCGLDAGDTRYAVQMLFGRAIGTEGEVSEDEWRDFLTRVVTPAFPEGLTVFDAQGQWRDTATGAVVREPSKVVLVFVADTAAAMPRLEAIADAYKVRFKQQAVGIVAHAACTVFR